MLHFLPIGFRHRASAGHFLHCLVYESGSQGHTQEGDPREEHNHRGLGTVQGNQDQREVLPPLGCRSKEEGAGAKPWEL